MLLQHVWDLHFDPTTNIIDVLCRTRPPQDRRSASLSAHPYRPRRRVLCPVLLAKTLRSSTIHAGADLDRLFGARCIALFGYVYRSHGRFLRAQPIRIVAIKAES